MVRRTGLYSPLVPLHQKRGLAPSDRCSYMNIEDIEQVEGRPSETKTCGVMPRFGVDSSFANISG
jgi:hypothetical protein